MDHHRFDHLARSLSSISSRRGAVRALGGALIAALGASRLEEVAAACVPAGKKCGHGRKCCRGTKCVGGRCKCAAGVPCAGACCPGGQTCLGGRCCDGKPETCQGRQCGGATNACGQAFDCGPCPGGQACDDGTCRCPAGQTRCADGACRACCVDGDCAGNRICQNGSCRCAVGTKECNDACIPDASLLPGRGPPLLHRPGRHRGRRRLPRRHPDLPGERHLRSLRRRGDPPRRDLQRPGRRLRRPGRQRRPVRRPRAGVPGRPVLSPPGRRLRRRPRGVLLRGVPVRPAARAPLRLRLSRCYGAATAAAAAPFRRAPGRQVLAVGLDPPDPT